MVYTVYRIYKQVNYFSMLWSVCMFDCFLAFTVRFVFVHFLAVHTSNEWFEDLFRGKSQFLFIVVLYLIFSWPQAQQLLWAALYYVLLNVNMIFSLGWRENYSLSWDAFVPDTLQDGILTCENHRITVLLRGTVTQMHFTQNKVCGFWPPSHTFELG